MTTINRSLSSRLLPTAALALAMAMTSAPAMAKDVYLLAKPFNKSLPDGSGSGFASVPMWGYADCTPATGAVDWLDCGANVDPQSPGPVIRVPAGESLNIIVQNNLANANANITSETSVIIPALPKAMTPVRWTGTGDAARDGRIYSFDSVVAEGDTATYSWTTPAPGTYLYQSGTHPQVQVQMGLYGAVVVEAGPNLAYPATGSQPAVGYTQDATLVFSEVDPALHAAVADGTYGTPAFSSTEDYKPRFFLINGEAFDELNAPLLTTGNSADILLRFVNAGLENHSPQLLGDYFEVIAEDGHRAPTSRSQYTLLLPAGKSVDALFQPTEIATYTLFDRRLRTVNDTSLGGGMMARIDVGAAVDVLPNAQPDTNNAVQGGTAVTGNVLANDGGNVPGTVTSADIALDTAVATANGANITLNTDGSYSYTPPAIGNTNVDPTLGLTEVFNYSMADRDGDVSGPTSLTIMTAYVAVVAADSLYFSTAGDFAVPDVGGPYDDADIYLWNGSVFSRVFDGSLAGLPNNADIDALYAVDSDTFYMSFRANNTNTPIGTVDDSDIVMYDAGTWSMYFDGSDVGLTTDNEDVDAFDFLPDGSIVISTLGNPSVGIAGDSDEDLLRCEGTFGATTTCSWSLYFDGSDIGLGGNASEDVDGASVVGSTIYLSTNGAFNTGGGNTGQGSDVFACNAATTGTATACASFSLYFDGSVNGVSNNIDAIQVPAP